MAIALTVAWLLAGAGLAAGAFWGLLVTPESSVPSLLLSAVLVLALLAIVGVTINGAVLASLQGWSARVVAAAIRHLPMAILPLLLVAAAWWIAGRAQGWVDAHAGEISAWFIATLGWSDVTPLFTTVQWMTAWARWVAAPFVAIAWLAHLLGSGWQPSRSLLARALGPTRLALATLVAAALVWAPWRYVVPWKPRGLPPTAVEVVFVATKLGVVALVAATGVALIVRVACRTRQVRALR